MPGPEIGKAIDLEGMFDQRGGRLGGVAASPIGLADPIAELGVELVQPAVARATDHLAVEQDGKDHALFACAHAGNPLRSHLPAIGMRNGASHAGNVIVAGQQADAPSVCKLRRA